MKSLIEKINKIKESETRHLIDSRIIEFQKIKNKKSNKQLFQELCFCILAANFNAERSLDIQNKIGSKFLTLSEKQLAQKLRQLGYRFPNIRAKYIVGAREHKQINQILNKYKDEQQLREYIVKNIKGLGMKEASHFLRNIGYTNSAIIDFHIVDILEKHDIIEKPKTMTKNSYLKIEDKLRKIAERTKLNLAELDLYLWFQETGKVLK
ncbi:N-glycosylase/DNA lyase [Candidatus Woesearchaeota archaeon]|nr:N-glycosylase/DNA lyase [Candidatus Woesearchaeota archaeon]